MTRSIIGEDWGHGDAWCPVCRSRAYLADSYTTDDLQGREIVTQPLQCGHNAADGGHPAYQPRHRRADTALIERLVALQEESQ